jgi:DNA-binding IscR family transcriptional regulator
MKLTQGADYGMVAVLYLSQRSEDRRYSLDEISQATEIPEEFLRNN